jgi:hypothetical protein
LIINVIHGIRIPESDKCAARKTIAITTGDVGDTRMIVLYTLHM